MGNPLATVKNRVTSPEAQDAFKRWFDAAPIYSGTPLTNRLGWQVVRTVAKNQAISLRRRLRNVRLPADLAATLDRDGIVAIPNYLPPHRYEALKRAVDDYTSSPRMRDVGAENGTGIRYLTGPVVAEQPGDSGEVIGSMLAEDPLLVQLAEYVIGRKVRTPLRVVQQVLEVADGQVDDRDREQILHADKAFPCVKAIYVVDELTERASPFWYAIGSHRITSGRLRYERAMGVRDALLRRGQPRPESEADGIVLKRGRNAMSDALEAELAPNVRPMTCAGNTMIVTNNAGFHRRGQLEPGERRRTLWINFYPYQRPWYGKVAFRAAKSVIDTDNVSRALPEAHRRLLEEPAPY